MIFTLSNIILILVYAVFLVLGFSVVISSFSIAPWVPSKRKDFVRINKLASLQPGQSFIELGCGDGRVSRYIAKKNPESDVIGIELAIPVFLWAKLAKLIFGPKNLTIKFGNALEEDLTKADVIYTFALIGTINGKLKKKFEKELKKGARLLSYDFSIRGWKGKEFLDKPDRKSSSIHVYSL